MLCKNRNVEPVRLQVFISVTFILDSFFFDILRKLTKTEKVFYLFIYYLSQNAHAHNIQKINKK